MGRRRPGRPPQTREHSDLALWLSAADFELFVVVAGELRIDRLAPWPGDRPRDVVVTDGALLRIDLHLQEPVDDDAVHCESLPWSLRWHQDHAPRDVDRHDVTQLNALAVLPVPERCALEA